MYVGSIIYVVSLCHHGGPTSVTESETNCFSIIQLYNMMIWRLNFTNENHKVIRV